MRTAADHAQISGPAASIRNGVNARAIGRASDDRAFLRPTKRVRNVNIDTGIRLATTGAMRRGMATRRAEFGPRTRPVCDIVAG